MNWHKKFQITLGLVTEVLIAWNIMTLIVEAVNRVVDIMPSWLIIIIASAVIIGVIVYSYFAKDDSEEEVPVPQKGKKKYFRGNPIESIFEFCSLDAQSLVYWHDKIKHISVIKSMPYRVVESAISHKALFKAIKKSEVV